MKGIRFYEELEHKNRKAERSKGSVVAALHETGHYSGRTYCYEAISGLYDEPNPPVCGGAVSIFYLLADCRRISEQRARELHPKLFERLDS